ncbi:MAG TPA: DUF1998 domain-containing protein [Polyangiaceae bacterium LLY-WYZ-14_1]|nr:DUF1998 domain-containing protein [Polyangiaceae bacterium LLY-WYZ-14_1]
MARTRRAGGRLMAYGGRKKAAAQPDGRVRGSQVITTFGPGAMLDLVDQAVLVGGLDYWAFDKKKGARRIEEPRLRDFIAERFKQLGLELSASEPFVEPPLGDDASPSKFAGIQVVEFPRWFLCQNPRCRALVRKDGLPIKNGRYHHPCDVGSRQSWETVPVRFVAACRRGHCDDFPWIRFAHAGRSTCAAPRLRLVEGATGDFSEIEVQCASCGASARLSAAMAKQRVMPCSGARPWLGGKDAGEPCEENARLLVRTASNSYFPQVTSALSVPEPGKELEDAVTSQWVVLQVGTPETIDTLLLVPPVKEALAGFDKAEVLAAITAKREGRASPRKPLRTAEYVQFLQQPVEEAGELPPPDARFFARRARDPDLPRGVSRVILASKLRKTVVQVGFTRLESITPDLQGELDLGVRTAKLTLAQDWLPATQVNGEGVLVVLDEAALQAWEARPAVVARKRELAAGYDAWTQTFDQPDAMPPFPGVRFYLLHSLSHLLVSAISLECGYSASAISERIYAGPSSKDPTPMAGVLLMTGSTGTEGTLGGLVDQGRRIRAHLRYAWELGRLCANDPVCAGHAPNQEESDRYLEGAACHGCLFIAECSCERFNRYLDRALVVPTVGRDPELAFFSERP